MSLFFKKKKKEEPVDDEPELPEELEKFRLPKEDVRESVPEELRLKTDTLRERRAAQPPVEEEPFEPRREPEREAEPDEEKMDLILSKLEAIEARLKMMERKMKA